MRELADGPEERVLSPDARTNPSSMMDEAKGEELDQCSWAKASPKFLKSHSWAGGLQIWSFSWVIALSVVFVEKFQELRQVQTIKRVKKLTRDLVFFSNKRQYRGII